MHRAVSPHTPLKSPVKVLVPLTLPHWGHTQSFSTVLFIVSPPLVTLGAEKATGG